MESNGLLFTWSNSQISSSEQAWDVMSVKSYSDLSLRVSVQAPMELEYYLTHCEYYSEPWGAIDPRFPLLAFSYGEGSEVNQQIASQVVTLMSIHSELDALLQWEIADIVLALAPTLEERVKAICFSDGETYMTTREVAAKALKLSTHRKVNLVAQLWHAGRCRRQSEEQGWHCISLQGVDAFAPNDPQPWVRHPLHWLVKESHFRYKEYLERQYVV